jgi:hypothetical protein
MQLAGSTDGVGKVHRSFDAQKARAQDDNAFHGCKEADAAFDWKHSEAENRHALSIEY